MGRVSDKMSWLGRGPDWLAPARPPSSRRIGREPDWPAPARPRLVVWAASLTGPPAPAWPPTPSLSLSLYAVHSIAEGSKNLAQFCTAYNILMTCPDIKYVTALDDDTLVPDSTS